MQRLEWSEAYSLDFAKIDDQHKHLIDLANRILDAVEADHGDEIVIDVVDDLVDYVNTHFSAEEKMFEENGYPQFLAHKQVHEALTAELMELVGELRLGFGQFANDFVAWVSGRLVPHFLTVDKQAAVFLRQTEAARTSLDRSRAPARKLDVE